MKITTINPTTLNHLRATLIADFQKEAEKLGLNVEAGTIKYSENQFSFKCEVKLLNESGKVQVSQLEQEAIFLDTGVKLGATITIKGQDFEITGYNFRKPKNCIKIKSLRDGKSYSTSAETAKHCARKILANA